MPTVSIIVPCYNEQATIRLLLDAVYSQTFPRHELEVILADGRSTDRTRQEVADYLESHPDLTLTIVDNPRRHIPAGLNCAIQAARGDIIVRLDGHCMPGPEYVERSVAGIKANLGWNVGGIWQIRPGGDGWLAESIAAAASHPLGVGDALYRYSEQAAAVDTVPFGAFKRTLVAEIGGFDESLLTNEDYEFNTRIRKKGGVVWLDPEIRSVYFARSSLGALAKQYARYGFWKWKMLRRYPDTLRWRQALPPLFVLSLIALSLAALLWPPAGWILLLEAGLYFLILSAAALRLALRNKQVHLVLGLPLAIAVMHLSWGAGFLWSMLKP